MGFGGVGRLGGVDVGDEVVVGFVAFWCGVFAWGFPVWSIPGWSIPVRVVLRVAPVCDTSF